jgi:PAS domain S-box-containing protein
VPNAHEPDEKALQRGDASVAPVDLRHPIQLQTSIFDQVSDAIIITDLEGKIVFWNKQTTVLTQVSEKDALDKSIFDVVVPKIRAERGMEIVDEFNATGHWKGEITFQRKDGSTFIASITSSLLKDDSGTPIGIVGLGRDVTETKRTEAALKEYSEELKQSNEELENFANIASHDLREPLRMISNYLSLLEKRYKGKVLDEKAEEYIHFAVDGASRMGHLIDDLLDYSRLERTGKPSGSVDMNLVIDQVVRGLKLILDGSGSILTHDLLPTILADQTQMVQLLQNLISNAVKYQRERPPRIHVSAKQEGGDWVFAVQDNGIGIPTDQQEGIFQMFHRLHTQEEYPGTGIGLAISKKIVERHRGRIWVESDGKSGSTFYFTIPKTQDI